MNAGCLEDAGARSGAGGVFWGKRCILGVGQQPAVEICMDCSDRKAVAYITHRVSQRSQDMQVS